MRHLIKLSILVMFCLLQFGAQATTGKCDVALQDAVPDATWGAEFLNSYKAYNFKRNPIALAVQVQALHDSSHGRKALAEMVAKTIQARYPGVSAKVEGQFVFDIIYKKNGEAYTYRLNGDPAIKKEFGFSPVMVNSPVLRDEDDVELFYAILDNLKARHGLREASDSNGVSVRVGLPGGKAQERALMALLFENIEEEFKKELSIDRGRREDRSQKVSAFMGSLLGSGGKTISFDSIKDILDGNHLFSLEASSLSSFKAVDFRLFNSSVDERELRIMLDFSTKFVKAIRSKEPKLLQLLESYKGAAPPFRELAAAIDFDTESKEAKAVLNKMWWDSLKSKIGWKLTRPKVLNALGASALAVAAYLYFMI